jgi:hypothetical protein
MKARYLLVLVVSFLTFGVARSNPVDINVQPAFLGQMNAAIDTYRADLTNNSAVTQQGQVSVNDPYGAVYPFRLEPGEKKFIYLYQTFTTRGDWFWNLKSAPAAGGGPVTKTTMSEHQPAQRDQTRYLLVLDSSESMSTGRGSTTRPPLGEDGRYECLPDRLPSRGSAYRLFNVIVVSDKAAKLISSGARRALSEYVLCGGEIAFCSSSAAQECGFTISQTDQTSHFGLGNITTLDTDIFRPGAVGIQNVKTLTNLVESCSRRIPQMDPGLVDQPGSDQKPEKANQAQDPFSTKLPPFSKVATLLSLYFLAVVPCNYLLLRKMQRPELTWITAPLLAGVFAAVLFSSANALYKDGPASATRGTLLVQEGASNGFFNGVSEIFWAKSGTVSLQIPGCEYIDDRNGSGSQTALGAGYQGTNPNQTPTGISDNGSGFQWTYASRNLELKEVGLMQQISTAGWFTFTSDADGGKFSVTNNSPYPVDNASLHVGYASTSARTLKRGETISVRPATDLRKSLIDANNGFPARPDRIGLSGSINDLPVGVRFGKTIFERTDIALEAYAKDSVGELALDTRPSLIFPILK